MRAPRRVPWASKAELNELYDLIFSPDATAGTKMRGLERMSIYISSPSCPAFLPILYALVAADLLPAPSNIIDAQSTRLSCAMAIVRLINGMVDPLQTGPYARPISHLAATLHIPPSLISLRHRATHEDLPPLALLRASVVQCIAYLHTYSFLPLLAESSTQPTNVNADRAVGLVARYKRVSKDKARDRDVDDAGPRAKELRKIKRAMEVEDTQDVVDALCTTEGLVPVSKKKRPSSRDEQPKDGTIQLWAPLIRHLSPYHPNLPNLLAQSIVAVMLEPMDAGTKDEAKEQASFRWSLAVWLIWMWGGRARDLVLAVDEKKALWAQLLPVLLQGTSLLASCLADADPASATGWFQLEGMLPPDGASGGLKGFVMDERVAGGADVQAASEGPESLDNAFEEMQARMAQFEQMMSGRKSTEAAATADQHRTGDANAPGWRRLTTREWRPCPIGMSGLV